jgi:mono/diheme cytochrome c family protein
MVAEVGLLANKDRDQQDKEQIAKGRSAIKENCGQCHKFTGIQDPGAGAPDLTKYGSEAWLKEFIANPAHTKFYGDKNDRMPAFAPGKTEADAVKNLLSAGDIEMLARWLRHDDLDLYAAYGKERPKTETAAEAKPAAEKSGEKAAEEKPPKPAAKN